MNRVALVAAVLAVGAVQGFYLPGLAPVNYCLRGVVDENKCQVSHVFLGALTLARMFQLRALV